MSRSFLPQRALQEHHTNHGQHFRITICQTPHSRSSQAVPLSINFTHKTSQPTSTIILPTSRSNQHLKMHTKSASKVETASMLSTSSASTITSLKSLLHKRSEKTTKSSRPKPTPEQLAREKQTRAEATAAYFVLR